MRRVKKNCGLERGSTFVGTFQKKKKNYKPRQDPITLAESLISIDPGTFLVY